MAIKSKQIQPEKPGRQLTLSKLLTEHDFSNQTEVVAAMAKQGFNVTQASISRDFKELEVIKIGGNYRPARFVIQGNLDSPIKNLIRSISFAGDNLVVVKTSSGGAAATAEAIDLEHVPGIVGTVAGDNTIFIATTGKKVFKLISDKIGKL